MSYQIEVPAAEAASVKAALLKGKPEGYAVSTVRKGTTALLTLLDADGLPVDVAPSPAAPAEPSAS